MELAPFAAVLPVLLLPAGGPLEGGSGTVSDEKGDEGNAADEPEAPLPATLTFNEHLAPVVFANCSSCHRPGEGAPFPLLSYADVRKRAKTILEVVDERYMPPWPPVLGHGEFQGSRRLAERDVALFAKWVADGMLEGAEHPLPAMPDFPAGWQLGEPDLVLQMERGFEVPAGGPDVYRNFVLPLELEEDRWVTAIELRPAARSVVHHSLFYLDDSGAAREADGADGTPGFRGMGFRRSGYLGGWAVGATPRHLPGGLAMSLPKGSDIVLSTHFHPSGKPEVERTTIGLYFAEKAPERTLFGFQVPVLYGRRAGIDIPAGDPAFTIEGSFEVPVDVDLIGAGGHAHYLCRTLDAVATLPGGEDLPLLRIDDWDFDWQGRYHYAEPVRLPAGTVVRATLVYDNSAANPENPHSPPQRVQWGLESTDEMGSVIFSAVPAREADLPEVYSALRRQLSRDGTDWIGSLVERARELDADGDGRITRAEFPARFERFFERIDRDGDGALTTEELDDLARRSASGF